MVATTFERFVLSLSRIRMVWLCFSCPYKSCQKIQSVRESSYYSSLNVVPDDVSKPLIAIVACKACGRRAVQCLLCDLFRKTIGDSNYGNYGCQFEKVVKHQKSAHAAYFQGGAGKRQKTDALESNASMDDNKPRAIANNCDAENGQENVCDGYDAHTEYVEFLMDLVHCDTEPEFAGYMFTEGG